MNPLGGVVPGKEEVGETVGETGCGGDDNELLLVTPKKECEAPPLKKEKKKKGTTRSRLMSVVRQTSRKSKCVQPTIQKVANVQFKN